MAKRFIAGAVCPKCEKIDKIYVEDNSQVAKCAACGYELQQPDAPQNSQQPDEAVTLVNFKTKK